MKTKLLPLFCRPAKKSNANLFFTSLLLVLVGLGSTSKTTAQVASYGFTGTGIAQTYTSLPNTNIVTWVTPPGTTNWDNNAPVTVPIGFNFNFNGIVYTTVNVSPNGFITFGTVSPTAPMPSSTNYTPIASTEIYDGAISVYGYDLLSNGIAIRYLTTGTAPTRTFAIEYVAYRKGDTSATMYSQIILNESDVLNPKSGVVELLYKAFTTTQPINRYGQIGLRGEKNTDYKSLKFSSTSAWPTTFPSGLFTVGTTNGAIASNNVITRSGAPIGANTRFTFTPPTCFAPKFVTPTLVTISDTSASFSWSIPNPAPSGGYEYLVTATPPNNPNVTFPNAGTAITGTVGPGITTASVSGLTANIPYWIYVRSLCAPPNSGWSAAGTFSTLCTPTTTIYTQDFGATTAPPIPVCNYSETINTIITNNYWKRTSPTLPTWGFPTTHLRITVDGGNDNYATYFTEGINLTIGQRYRIEYVYGSSVEISSTSQNMIVRYGTAPYDAAMTTTLADHVAFRGGPFTNVVNFTATYTGVHYFGFTDYSEATNASTLLDNIDIRPSTCIGPSGITASGITSGSAGLSWIAPVGPPAFGYFYYISTSPTPPLSYQILPSVDTVPTGSVLSGTAVTVTGLSPSTTYYVWVASNCGNGDMSPWIGSINFTTSAGSPPAACNPSGAGFFQDPNGITNVTFGTINNTTGIEANNYGNYASLVTSVAQGAVVPVSITYRTGFSYDTKIWIDWNGDGTFTDAAPELMYTGTSTGANPTTLVANMTIPNGAPAVIGTQYRMRIGGIDSPIFPGGALTPCRTGAYQAYEDYSVFVTAPPPAISLSAATATICNGLSTSVTLSVALQPFTYYTYTWSSPSTVTGTAPTFTFNPTATTTYTVTGVNSSNLQTTTATFTVIVKPAPTPVTVTPATATVCEGAGPAQALTITPTSGIISGVTIYNENFNGLAPGWMTTYLTYPETVWALQPNGYNPFLGNMSSNDASQFAFAESDATGSGFPGPTPATYTTLTSPAINLAGYTSAQLDFWHVYLRFNENVPAEGGYVQISTTGPTGTFTDLITYGGANVGTVTNWAQAIINLTPYIGQTIHLRWVYDASWDWGWGIDNVNVTGSAVSTVTWSPTAGLWNDAAATIPYTGTNATTVYALPTTTTTYTAVAASNGCSSLLNNSSTVTVTPLNGTATPSSQTVCSGVVTPITLTPLNGTVVQWQYSNSNSPYTWVNMPASTGTTLSSAEIGFLTANRWFRAQLSGCGTNYSTVAAVTVNSTTYNGTVWSAGLPAINKMVIYNFVGSVTVGASISACSVYVQNGNVTMGNGFTMTVENGVHVTDGAGTLTFNDDSSLVQVQNTVNTGDITYKRVTGNLRKFDYTIWSSPVNTQYLTPFSPNTQVDKFYRYNTTLGTEGQWENPGPWPFTTTPMVAGKGYLIRAPNTNPEVGGIPYNAVFGWQSGPHGLGVPNNGDVVLPVQYVSPTQNLNCLGNPYPSAIDADLLVFGNMAAGQPFNGGTTFYFWTHNTAISGQQYTDNDYASFNSTGGTGTGVIAISGGTIPNGNISAGQGFMVRAKAPGNVTFRNTMRLTGLNNQFFRMDGQQSPMTALEKHRMWLELSNAEGAYKQTLVGYIESATNALDGAFDGEWIDGGNSVNFYSVIDDSKLVIQGRALPFDSNDVVPLGYTTTVPGTYLINLGLTDGLFSDDQDVYLEDTLLNVVHNLKSGPYSFATEAGNFETRFILRYTNTLATEIPLFNENGVVVYKNNNIIYVKTSNITMDSVKLFDLRGREIFSREGINNDETEISNLNAAQQVLLIQVTSTDNVTVSKKIVF